MLLIQNGQLFTASDVWTPGWVLTEGERIVQMGPGSPPDIPDARVIDASGCHVLPGFIDVHTHGAVGHEAMDATQEALQAMARFYASHGVTAFLPTTWTDSDSRITAALQAIAENVGPQPDGATILGTYLEGPYLNPERCGAQSTEHIRRAPRDEARRYLDFGVVRELALAPEYPENHWLIDACVREGIVVSAAHTAATYEDMCQAAASGVTQATHTFNAMTGLHHRAPGMVGAVLTLDTIRAELIADGIHVHPAVMAILFACKGPDKTILITDAIRGTGLPDGKYPIDTRYIQVTNGVARLPDGTLAGSTLTMDRALQNFRDATQAPLESLWPTTSLNAARAMRIDDRKGSLAVGKDADLVLLDDSLTACTTIAQGQVIYTHESHASTP